MPIDLRSDLLARPSETMLEAMMAAGRQSRSYGHREGVLVQEFQRRIAALLGMEDALLFPTCTMANQASLMSYCRRGEIVLADAEAHLNLNEASSTNGIAGTVMRFFPSERGHPIAGELDGTLDEQRASLIWLENTHNRAGGTVMSPVQLAEVVSIARRRATPIHIDGARLWNAMAASGNTAAGLVAGANSVALSLNKCLGVPVGAALVGDKSFIARAAELQIMLGGGWRSTDMIAAAGLAALESLPLEVLQKDHEIARLLASGLRDNPLVDVDHSHVETNIVYARPREGSVGEIMSQLRERGVLITGAGERGIRFVIYHDIREPEVSKVLDALDDVNSKKREMTN